MYQPYKNKSVLSFEVPSLGYEVKCKHRALNAESVIHHVMGLQILDGMDMRKVHIDQISKILQRKLTYEVKRYRIQMKVVQLVEQQEQKQWTTQQQLSSSCTVLVTKSLNLTARTQTLWSVMQPSMQSLMWTAVQTVMTKETFCIQLGRKQALTTSFTARNMWG